MSHDGHGEGGSGMRSEGSSRRGGLREITDAAQARETLRPIMEGARSAVFFGGAGVSTESGIPDFRSARGIYNSDSGLGYPPETIISHSFFLAHPREFWQFYRSKMVFVDAQPNACHRKLAELERAGHLAGVVTQNIDGLHQAAGSSNVLELHGSIHRNHCMECGKSLTLAETLKAADKASDGVPRCPVCSAMVKPDVVLYEEPLDESVMIDAARLIAAADVLVVAGTSLAVWPAAGFIEYFRGSMMIVANLSPTSADANADLVVRVPVGAAFDW